MKQLKNLFILLTLSLFSSLASSADSSTKNKGQEDYDFLIKQIKNTDYKYSYFETEQIVSGMASSLVGIAGYHLSSNDSVKLAYSGVQAIGSTTVGFGLYNYLRPKRSEFYKNLVTLEGNKNSEKKVNLILDYLAKEARAKRLAVIGSTGMLSLQFASNLIFDDPEKKLRNIYIYLGGVNLLALIYQTFVISGFESYQNSKKVSFHPVIGIDSMVFKISKSF